METKKLKVSIDFILKDLRKNAIFKEHRKDSLNIDCPECKFRLLEAYLEWYLDLLKWETKK